MGFFSMNDLPLLETQQEPFVQYAFSGIKRKDTPGLLAYTSATPCWSCRP
jgi:hypothetical protein